MTQRDREQIAAGRFHIIAPVVNRSTTLISGEVSAWFREAVQKSWTHEPYWANKHFGLRTLERWKQLYEKCGFEGLMPAIPKKRSTTAIPELVLKQAEAIRIEMPKLSVETILYLLHKEYDVERGAVNPSTLARHFRREGLTRQRVSEEKSSQYGFRRFESETPMQLWQSDFQHTLYLPDPLNPNKRKLAKLCLLLDDHARYVVHGQFYWDEKMPSLEDSLKKAIEKHGIPDQCYTDNGSAFSAGHISRICARLGIRLSHTRPYKPQGKGKAERVFGFIDTSFLPIAMNKISKNLICTLDDLNLALQDWLEEHYHIRKHGETGESPRVRMGRHPVRQLPYSKQELRRLFFLEETRKVDKTGTVSLDGLFYEVPVELCGTKVQIRYDPYDPSDADVHVNNVLVGKAVPRNPVARYQKHFRKEKAEDRKADFAMGGQLVFSISGGTVETEHSNKRVPALEVGG